MNSNGFNTEDFKGSKEIVFDQSWKGSRNPLSTTFLISRQNILIILAGKSSAEGAAKQSYLWR